MQFDIISIGALLVEIMRKEKDIDFEYPGDFCGPYPSGDTPIFINAAAKLGMKCGFIGTVGNDGFGRCVLNRLKENQVDTQHIRVIDGVSTAVTFIAYFQDGSRKFLYHLHNAAAGLLDVDDVDRDYVRNTKWVHLTGFSLSGSESSRKAALKILDYIPDTVKVSFDPNIRVEALGLKELRKIVEPVIERSCLILPSMNEAKSILGMNTDEQACEYFVKKGKIVAQKLGPEGCKIYTQQEIIHVPTFSVKEIDPTGAGDTFSAAFISQLIEGKSLREAGKFANIAGTLSIRKKGPMEGSPDRAQVENILRQQKSKLDESLIGQEDVHDL